MNKIIGTAGHIDHGKSSLVRALTGIDPDRLPEEKERGVTIELGFAQLSLSRAEHPDMTVGLIDVPGHADFINNMLAGVTDLDLALLVVAADDGWMPQTEEHLQILAHLHVPRLLVVITKIDLLETDEELEFVREMIREDLAQTCYAEAEILPVSVVTKQGIEPLKERMSSHLYASPTRADTPYPYLPVDRAFSVKGVGTVVTGTLSQGSICVGDQLEIQPSGQRTVVRGVQTHSNHVQKAYPSSRTALQLSDAPLASESHRQGVKRGLIITAHQLTISTTIDVVIGRLQKEIPRQPVTKKPLKTYRKVTIHHGSAHLEGRLLLVGQKQLCLGEESFAQLRFAEAHYFRVGDRLIIRDGSATLAGAVVLDPDAHRRMIHKEVQNTYLLAVQSALSITKEKEKKKALFLAFMKRKKSVNEAQMKAFLLSSEDLIESLVRQLSKKRSIVLLKTPQQTVYLEASWWNGLIKKAAQIIKDFHQRHPDLFGIEGVELRQSLEQKRLAYEPVLEDQYWHAFIEELEHQGHQRKESLIANEGHSLELPSNLEPLAQEILSRLKHEALNPPLPAELAPQPSHQKALEYLLRTEEILKLDDKVFLAMPIFQEAKDEVIKYLKEHETATASELRQHLSTSRKVIMPFLERLDKEGVTVRRENERILRKP